VQVLCPHSTGNGLVVVVLGLRRQIPTDSSVSSATSPAHILSLSLSCISLSYPDALHSTQLQEHSWPYRALALALDTESQPCTSSVTRKQLSSVRCHCAVFPSLECSVPGEFPWPPWKRHDLPTLFFSFSLELAPRSEMRGSLSPDLIPYYWYYLCTYSIWSSAMLLNIIQVTR